MDEILEKAKEIRQEINNLPEVKEYLTLKNLFENDQELKELRENIAKLEHFGKKEEKENLIKIYNSHPVVNNFYIAKQEVINILNQLKDILD